MVMKQDRRQTGTETLASNNAIVAWVNQSIPEIICSWKSVVKDKMFLSPEQGGILSRS